jgi:WhiB family transcriptional regulator, redox-sensing transcriptional regulator
VNPYTVSGYLREREWAFEPLEAPEDLRWQDQALCTQTDPAIFFVEKGASTRPAKRVCMSCEVRAECLEYALDTDQMHGVWGGMSDRERRRLKRQRAASPQSTEVAA